MVHGYLSVVLRCIDGIAEEKRTDLYELPTVRMLALLKPNNLVSGRGGKSTLGKRWSVRTSSGLPWLPDSKGTEDFGDFEVIEGVGIMIWSVLVRVLGEGWEVTRL